MPGYGNAGSLNTADKIVRVCKNAAGNIVATQTISVTFDTVSTVDGRGHPLSTPEATGQNGATIKRFMRTATSRLIKTERSLLSAASRAITTIETTGNFNTRTEASNDVVSATYLGDGLLVNNVTVGVNTIPGVFKIGDSV